MEQDEGVDFKTLRAKFQNGEALKIQTKPALPEKPKTLTSPTTKISNPLVASMNLAMEKRIPVAPRVVFKDEKKSPVKRQSSHSDVFLSKVNDSQPELQDTKQKKEGDIIKALKDKNLPLVLPVSPVTPVIEETLTPEPDSTSPVSESQVKESTPKKKKKKNIFNFRKSAILEKDKSDTAEGTVSAGPGIDNVPSSSSTAVSETPIVSKPVAPTALLPPVKTEAVSVCSNPAPVVPTPDIPAPVIPAPVIPASVTPAPVVPAAVTPAPVVTAAVTPAPVIPVPVTPAPVITLPKVPEPDVPVLTAPEPDIVSQVDPELDIPEPEGPVTPNLSVTLLQIDPLPEEITHPSEIPDILDIVIPPPIIPEDVPDADISISDIPAPLTPDPPILFEAALATPVSSSPNFSHTASPAPASVTPESLTAMVPDRVTINADTASDPSTSTIVSSPAPAPAVEPEEALDQVEKMSEVPSSVSSKTISALSALERAEEMVPVRHNPCDQRVLKLLEKAKRKHALSHQAPTPTTPEMMTPVETALPTVTPPGVSSPEEAQPIATQTEPILVVDPALVPETPLALHDTPTIDHEDQAEIEATMKSNAPTSETPLSNDLEHSPVSTIPKVLAVQSPAKVKAGPPPPPPRKYFPAASNETIAPEKPPRVASLDLQTLSLLAQQVEDNGTIIPAPVDFTSENVTSEDTESEAAEHGNSAMSVHEQVFLEQFSREHHSSEEFVPNAETTETHSTSSKTQTLERLDSETDNFVIPSPSRTPEIVNNSFDSAHEDLAANNKAKTLKKQRKGTPMNPYADSLAVNEDTSRKTLFARKSASLDSKEMKKKEKEQEKEKEKEKKEPKEKEKEKKEQKEKDKEKKEKEKEKEKKEKGKEKEKEKKEHKEKEKEKKEQKDKKKEKEHKEKEKEKKEHEDKEKEKKEQKEKEREKKEQKEKEKKEQKEKEKKENEMKKKFKIAGDEEELYQVKVLETCKGRKNDLAVKAGDTVSILRTTDCPKGKWLARDSSNKYGYIPVESVQLDIQEMMEVGKRAKASHSNGLTDPEVTSAGSRSSNQYIVQQESFTDDSEEWGDDDDTPFTPTDNTDLDLNQSPFPLETVSPEPDSALQAQTDANDNVQARQEALQKLATFFAQPRSSGHATLNRNTIIEEPEPEEPPSPTKQDVDLQILPPPDLYADIIVG